MIGFFVDDDDEEGEEEGRKEGGKKEGGRGGMTKEFLGSNDKRCLCHCVGRRLFSQAGLILFGRVGGKVTTITADSLFHSSGQVTSLVSKLAYQ